MKYLYHLSFFSPNSYLFDILNEYVGLLQFQQLMLKCRQMSNIALIRRNKNQFREIYNERTVKYIEKRFVNN